MKSFNEFINESGLSRIWSQVQDHEPGAISGYRGDNKAAQNKDNNRQIVAYLKSKGYSVTKVKGSYIENFGSDNAREVGEPSFFVVDIKDTGKLEDDLRKLGQKFDQDSILIVPKGGKGAYLVGTSKRDDSYPPFGKKEVVGNSKFGKVAGQFLSRIKGRAFAFETVEEPQTINGKRGWAILAKRVDEELKSFE